MNKKVLSTFAAAVCLAALLMSLGCTGGRPNATEPPEATEPPKLSEMTEEECRAFLSEHGIEIPAEAAQSASIKGLFAELEEDPDREYFFSAFVMLTDFTEEVKALVKEYYGIENDP